MCVPYIYICMYKYIYDYKRILVSAGPCIDPKRGNMLVKAAGCSVFHHTCLASSSSSSCSYSRRLILSLLLHLLRFSSVENAVLYVMLALNGRILYTGSLFLSYFAPFSLSFVSCPLFFLQQQTIRPHCRLKCCRLIIPFSVLVPFFYSPGA